MKKNVVVELTIVLLLVKGTFRVLRNGWMCSGHICNVLSTFQLLWLCSLHTHTQHMWHVCVDVHLRLVCSVRCNVLCLATCMPKAYFIFVLMAIRVGLFLLPIYVYPLNYHGCISLAVKDSWLWPFYNKSMLVLLLVAGCINAGSNKLCSIYIFMSGPIVVTYVSKM